MSSGMHLTRRHLVLGAILTGPLAAACSLGGGSGPPPAALKAGSTLVFWNDQGAGYAAVMNLWADTFQQKTGVKVEATAGISGLLEKLAGAFAAGTPPDVFRYSSAQLPIVTAVERNMLMKLDAFVKRDKYDLADFRKDAINLYRWKGALYALPRDYGLQLVYYSTDLFQRAGLPPIPTDWNDKTWTYQKFVDTCQRLVSSGVQYALFVNRVDRMWASWIYSNGGAIVRRNQDGLATEFALVEKPATDALQLMQDLIYKYRVAPLPSEERDLGDKLALMQAGKLAMQFANPSTNAGYKAIVGLPYDVGVFPAGGASRRGVGGGGTGWAISAPTKLPDEAWAFVAHIASRDAELQEVAIGQTTPSRVSVATSKEYLAPPPPHAKVFADGQEYVTRDPVHTRWTDVNREVVAKLLTDQLWSGKNTAAQVTQQIKQLGDPYLK